MSGRVEWNSPELAMLRQYGSSVVYSVQALCAGFRYSLSLLPPHRQMFRTAFIAATAVLLACDTGGQQEASPHTIADFQALRFLEGHWRGSGYAGGPFFESYRFENDSTIAMTAWSDSTMTTPSEEKQYQLRDGQIGTNDGARLVRVDSAGHTFERGSARWTFRRVSADRWTARVGQTTTYTMDRMGGR